eukprot:1033000-Prorocentrum_minimum.AAC.1
MLLRVLGDLLRLPKLGRSRLAQRKTSAMVLSRSIGVEVRPLQRAGGTIRRGRGAPRAEKIILRPSFYTEEGEHGSILVTGTRSEKQISEFALTT